MTTKKVNCFYASDTHRIIDMINELTGKTWINSETLEQVQQRYPGAALWDLDEAIEHMGNAAISPPEPITEEIWLEMLYVMPPMKWRGGGDSESFMLCEAQTMDIHNIYCRIDDRYYKLVNRKTITHDEIANACRAYEAERNAIAQAEATAADEAHAAEWYNLNRE
jgi:hypothetical protein